MAGKTAILSLKIIGDATGAQKAAADTKKEISGLEKAIGKAKTGLNLAGAAAGAGLAAGLASAMEADGANRKLAASMGLDPAEAAAAGKLSGNLYKNAYGDSLEQVNDTIAGVASTLADFSTNGGADVERLSQKALNLAAAFPEVGDGVATAGILMKTGLAKSADEAYDLMAGSLQKVPKAMQAELFPVMDEYSKHFADLGIDGTTAFGIMAEASKGGAIAMDKTGDALKEFTIRASDGSKATSDAYKSIGLDAEEMARKIAAGGPGAADAFAKTVAGLQAIKDPAAQAQAAIGLFGTPLEDLGTAKIPEFLGAIDPMGDSFDSLAGKADAMGATINAGPSVALETLKRTAMDSFTQMGAAALPVLAPIIATLQQYAPVIGPVAVAVAGLAAMVWLINGAMAAWNAVQLVGKGIMIASTAVQWAFNAAMAANPIGLVVIAIAALVAGVILAYNNIGWFKDAVDNAGRVAGDIFRGMGDGIAGVIGWVQSAIGWFQSLFGAKNDAASVQVGGADSGGMGLALASAAALPAAGLMGAAAAPAPGTFGASYAAASSSLSGPVSRGGGAGTIIHNTFSIKVEATPGTDRVALGRDLAAAIQTYERSTGKTGGRR